MDLHEESANFTIVHEVAYIERQLPPHRLGQRFAGI